MTRRRWTPKIPTQGHTIFTMRGREIEYGLQSDEERFHRWKEETRHPLWAAALNAAMNNRHEFEKRLALGLGISLEFWPEAAPLNGKERTLLLEELRSMWGIGQRE